jgi:hypothetical protein
VFFFAEKLEPSHTHQDKVEKGDSAGELFKRTTESSFLAENGKIFENIENLIMQLFNEIISEFLQKSDAS